MTYQHVMTADVSRASQHNPVIANHVYTYNMKVKVQGQYL